MPIHINGTGMGVREGGGPCRLVAPFAGSGPPAPAERRTREKERKKVRQCNPIAADPRQCAKANMATVACNHQFQASCIAMSALLARLPRPLPDAVCLLLASMPWWLNLRIGAGLAREPGRDIFPFNLVIAGEDPGWRLGPALAGWVDGERRLRCAGEMTMSCPTGNPVMIYAGSGGSPGAAHFIPAACCTVKWRQAQRVTGCFSAFPIFHCRGRLFSHAFRVIGVCRIRSP